MAERFADTITLDFRPRIRPTVAAVELDGEAVLYDEATEGLHHLNPTATVLFGCFDGHSSLRDIADDIAAVYEVEAPEVEAQVLELARGFGHLGLLDGVQPTDEEQPDGDGQHEDGD